MVASAAVTCPCADLDFNATTLRLELNAELVTISANISIPVYSDGVPEQVEGFAVLLGVREGDLDDRDVGFVNVTSPILVVRLEEGGVVKHLHGLMRTAVIHDCVCMTVQTPGLKCSLGTWRWAR